MLGTYIILSHDKLNVVSVIWVFLSFLKWRTSPLWLLPRPFSVTLPELCPLFFSSSPYDLWPHRQVVRSSGPLFYWTRWYPIPDLLPSGPLVLIMSLIACFFCARSSQPGVFPCFLWASVIFVINYGLFSLLIFRTASLKPSVFWNSIPIDLWSLVLCLLNS